MITGSLVAIVTPMHEDGGLDLARFKQLIDWHVAEGTDGIVVVGTTGESPTVNFDEHKELIRIAVQHSRGRIPIIAGTGGNSTAEAIELTESAKKAGATACLSVVPYYNKPTQEGLYRHFRTIAEHTALPCIVYNVPSRTVRNMEAATTIRLAQDVPNIVGLKEAVGSMEQIAEIIAGVPDDFRVWSGNDQDTFNLICLGGYGVVSVASHVVGRQIKQMIQFVVDGDTRAAARLHLRLLPLAKALFPPVAPVASPSSIKAALNLAGFDVGGLRLPLIELPEAAQTKLKDVLATYELDRLPVAATA